MKLAVTQKAIEIRAWRTSAGLSSIYLNSTDSHSIVKLLSASKVWFFSASVSWATFFSPIWHRSSCYLENTEQLLGIFSLICSFLRCQMPRYWKEEIWLCGWSTAWSVKWYGICFLPLPQTVYKGRSLKQGFLCPTFFSVPIAWMKLSLMNKKRLVN